jgi:hypothetical protein
MRYVSGDPINQEKFMPHQYLWSLALALIPAGLLLRATAVRAARPAPVPLTIDRSSQGRRDQR